MQTSCLPPLCAMEDGRDAPLPFPASRLPDVATSLGFVLAERGEGDARPPLSHLLGALSRALDLTEGRPMGHAIRSCLIGLRIAHELGLPDADGADLYLALLLKDAGCSSNAARMFALYGGDEITAKGNGKLTDWTRVADAMSYAFRHTLPQSTLWERLNKMRGLLGLDERVIDLLTESRCERGAQVAIRLGMSKRVSEAIYHLDEHWDGQGAPHRYKGEEIPLFARIACLAQTLEVFASSFDVPTAYAMAKRREGRWFDPNLVRAASAFTNDIPFWTALSEHPQETLDVETAMFTSEDEEVAADVDAVCEAFAGIVDAKSPFTADHSRRVADIAARTAQTLGFAPNRVTLLRRAGLLHDLGKLAVPNIILDKPGRLTEDEFGLIKKHPMLTAHVLEGLPTFERLRMVAAAHHEKLDGSGYWKGMGGSELDREMRILAVADIYDALSAARPYRDALPTEEVFAIMDREVAAGKLDVTCVMALRETPL